MQDISNRHVVDRIFSPLAERRKIVATGSVGTSMYCVKGDSKKCMKVDFSDQQFSLKGGIFQRRLTIERKVL